jgi:heme exporter protein A
MDKTATAQQKTFDVTRALTAFKLELNDIALSRGGHTLISGLTLTVAPGELLWVGGDNGIGKSSLLRVICGLSRPDHGQIEWTQNGVPCAAHDMIAYQGHLDAFKPNLTAREALSFWADVLDKDDTASTLLNMVGLGERADVPCGHLSAGQKRRLSLARIILSAKPLWIMDEPTAAMDADGVALIHGLISAHIARGGSAIIASHQSPVIAGLRTRQLVLEAAS